MLHDEEIARIHAEMEELFNRFAGRAFRGDLLTGPRDLEQRRRMPLADVFETEGSVVASIELPGIDKENIDLNVSDDYIEVRVEKREEKKDRKNGTYYYSEINRNFYRRIPLPTQIKPGESKATFNNGVLRIEAPKARKELKGTKVKIE